MTRPSIPCPRCGAAVERGLRFCEQCGTPLVSTPAAPAPASSKRAPVLLIGVAVVLVAAVAGAVFLFRGDGAGDGSKQAIQTATATARTATATQPAAASITATARPPATAPATAATTATTAPASVTATATRTPVPSPSPIATTQPTAPPTLEPPALPLPSAPVRQIPVPTGIDARTRQVIDVLNANGAVYAAAVRGPSAEPLSGVFTAAAYQYYAGTVARLQAAGQYEIADLLSISLTDLRFEGAGQAVATTVEVWQVAVVRAGANQTLSSTQTTYAETYRLLLVDGRWLIAENTFVTLTTTPR